MFRKRIILLQISTADRYEHPKNTFQKIRNYALRTMHYLKQQKKETKHLQTLHFKSKKYFYTIHQVWCMYDGVNLSLFQMYSKILKFFSFLDKCFLSS